MRGVIPGENLYGTLSSRESLRNGWFKVHATVRKSSHGIDNVTSAMFEEKLEAELGRLSDDLRSRTYRCKPLKSMVIPKPDGGQRRLESPAPSGGRAFFPDPRIAPMEEKQC